MRSIFLAPFALTGTAEISARRAFQGHDINIHHMTLLDGRKLNQERLENTRSRWAKLQGRGFTNAKA
jgi:hypothetical protein